MKARYYKYNLLLEDCDWAVAGMLLTDKELDRAIKNNRGRSGHFIRAKVEKACIIWYSFGYRIIDDDHFIQVPAEGKSFIFLHYKDAAAYIREQRSKNVKEIIIRAV